MVELTSIQRQVLATIRARVDRGDPAPTYRDLCAEFGWASTGTARDHLQALAKKGVLRLAGGRARLVRLQEEVEPVARVPLVGRIAAGLPVVAEEEIEGHLPVPLDWIRGGEHFALRVEGDSMRDAGILQGDLVIVRRQSSAEEGEVVAATVDGETTLKTFRLREGRPTLFPANPAYVPIDISEADTIIHGAVVGVMRQLGPRRRPRRATQFANRRNCRATGIREPHTLGGPTSR